MKAFRWFLVPLSIFPGACHFKVTGPALWGHNSSAAFDAWVGLWVLSMAAFVWAIVWALVGQKENP